MNTEDGETRGDAETTGHAETTTGPQRHGDTEINALTQRIIGCAIEVHRVLGSGLLEPVYETAMCIEMDAAGLAYARQVRLPAHYKGRLLGHYRIDLVVEDLVLVEIKSVERMNPLFEGQLLTYLRITNKRVGLLLNFNSRLMKDGITRLIL
jgi:GxxExxY protein